MITEIFYSLNIFVSRFSGLNLRPKVLLIVLLLYPFLSLSNLAITYSATDPVDLIINANNRASHTNYWILKGFQQDWSFFADRTGAYRDKMNTPNGRIFTWTKGGPASLTISGLEDIVSASNSWTNISGSVATGVFTVILDGNPSVRTLVITSGTIIHPTGSVSSGEIFISNPAEMNVRVINKSTSAEVRRLSGGNTLLNLPSGIDIDHEKQEIFLANSGNNTINVHDLSSSGNTPPRRQIGGESTGISFSSQQSSFTFDGIYVDSVNGELWVTNSGSSPPSITAYLLTDSGDVAPLRTIQGTDTTLITPVSIAVDTTNNEIFVADGGATNPKVVVFSRTADGDIAPIRTLNVNSIQAGEIVDIDVDVSNGELWVSGRPPTTGVGGLIKYPRTASGDDPPILRTGISGSFQHNGIFLDRDSNEVGLLYHQAGMQMGIFDISTGLVLDSIPASTGDMGLAFRPFKTSAPVAAFSADITNGIPPLTVNFTDQSIGSIDTWSWNFGDSSTSTQQHPSHTYSAAGDFTVSLTVTGPGGSDSETKTGFITISQQTTPTPTLKPTPTPVVCKAPIAEFKADKTSILEGEEIKFTDLSVNNPSSWIWDFGDGSAPVSNQNPSHIYNNAGKYSVTLTVSNECGEDKEIKTNLIEALSTIVEPKAEFSANPTSGFEPLTVEFQDKSTGAPTSWAWEFGDGNISNELNPSHTYIVKGIYNVMLTVSNSAGSDSIEKVNLINVIGKAAPIADFSANPTAGIVPLNVVFENKSTGDPTSWVWELGDGAVSIEENPQHTYNSAGIFTVGLLVSNSEGADWEIKTNLINIQSKSQPTAAFTATPQAGIAPMTVLFTDISEGDPESWIWKFGDGGISNLQNTQHTYRAEGFFSVSLTVSNANGIDIENQVNLINVQDEGEPVAEFIAEPLTGFAQLTVAFTDISNGNIENWSWDFGDGGISISQNPTHSYKSQGIFSVELIVSGSSGTDSEKKTNLINVIDSGASGQPGDLSAAFKASDRIGPASFEVEFENLSSGEISGWLWNFGDETTSDKEEPDHTYNIDGVYTVSLSVFNNGGKADTITKPAYIEIKEEEVVVTPTPEPEITPTPGPKKCLASDVLDQGNKKELDTIRGFRDSNLSKTRTGLKLIKLYYKHSGEVTEIVNQDEGLRFRTSSVLMDLVKVINQSGADTSLSAIVQYHIPEWLNIEINALVDEIAQQGSDELREAIKETYDLLEE